MRHSGRLFWVAFTIPIVGNLAWIMWDVYQRAKVQAPVSVSTLESPDVLPAPRRELTVVAPSAESSPFAPWEDPSIDPAVAKAAFEPLPLKSLPPAARPKPPEIMPSEREWRTLRQSQDAAAY